MAGMIPPSPAASDNRRMAGGILIVALDRRNARLENTAISLVCGPKGNSTPPFLRPMNVAGFSGLIRGMPTTAREYPSYGDGDACSDVPG